MGFDVRIGKHFLEAGLGYGGSCFPKDVKALAYMAEDLGQEPRILNSVMEVNALRRNKIVAQLDELLGGLKGRTIGMLGLAFKANTDDLREAPSLDIAEALTAAGAKVRAFDPVAMEGAAKLLPKVEMARDAYDLASGADALLVVTEWNEFKNLDMERVRKSMAQPVVLDGRNIYQPELMRNLGFNYQGVGRGFNGRPNGALKTEIKVRPNAA
jgi:UDPglucose 6-dehydrogenase